MRLLERRKAYLEDKLEEGRRSLKRATRGVADTYTVSLMHHGVETTEHDIAWLDTLISGEQAAMDDPQYVSPSDADEPPQPSAELQTK